MCQNGFALLKASSSSTSPEEVQLSPIPVVCPLFSLEVYYLHHKSLIMMQNGPDGAQAKSLIVNYLVIILLLSLLWLLYEGV